MNKGIGDDLRQMSVVTKYELLKHFRSKRMLIFVGIAAIIFVLLTALSFILDGKLPDEPKAFMELYVALMPIMIIIGVSLIFAPAIASEFEERTALLMFPRPMKKTTFFMGKLLSCFILCGAVVLLYYAVCIVGSLIIAGGLELKVFGSMGMALLFTAGTGGFALLMSSLFKKGSTSIIITVLILFLVFYSMMDGMFIMFDVEPVFSITYAGMDILNFISGHPSGLQTVNVMGVEMEMMYYYPTHVLAVSVMSVWAAVTITLSALLFRRREF